MSLFPEDKRAGVLGAVVTLAALVIIAFAINRMTVAAHSGGHEAPAAGQTSGH
ncbi:MAG TPA: hypothetical protein VFZ11_02240 [Gemmatimonadaceae bacterium]